MITVENLVAREVHYCVSYLVSTLAGGDSSENRGDLADMMEQALELACPIVDWEETAIQAGWRVVGNELVHDDLDRVLPLEDACAYETAACDVDADLIEREVYEHWIVSDWLADKLAAHGEKVDKDFAGMTVWARTTTGQGIASDSVIVAIHTALVESV